MAPSLTTLTLFITASVVFGFIVASFYHKSDRTNVYQKGRAEADEERAALKEKMQAKDARLIEISKERELANQTAETLKAEVEALRSGTPAPASVSDEQIQALTKAFEAKASGLIEAERAGSQSYREQAARQIAGLEQQLAEAAERAAEKDSAPAPMRFADFAQPATQLNESAVRARIADAVAAAQEESDGARQASLEALNDELATAREALAAEQEQCALSNGELQSLKQELARRQAELSARQEQSGVSNDAVEAVNMELLRIQHSLDETKLQLSEAVQGRQRAEASLQMDQANLLSQSKETINVAQWQERIAELQADIADGHAVETELRADAQALRDEIVELRGVSEEAEGRYAIATQASQELTETHQRSEGEWTAALASAKWEAQVAVAARQIVETALAAGQESDAKLAGALQETQTLLAASQQEAESLRLARVQETGIALAASQQEMEAMLAAVRREAEARTEAMGQKANGEALAARDAEHQEELRNAQAAVDARQTQHQEELSNSQAASVARETQLQEQLRDTEAALAEARESASVQAAAALAPPPASSQELSALRDLVLRLEGSLGETARERNGAIESLTSEVAGLKQIAALGRAICDGAARYATHADQLRINFDAALQALHQGNTAFASEVLGPVRQLQSALNPLAAAQPSGASVNDIGALQQAVDPVPPVVTVPEGLQAVV